MNSKVIIRLLCEFFILIIIGRINCNSCIVKQRASERFLQVVQGQLSGSTWPISWTQRIYSYDLCAHKLRRRKRSNFTARDLQGNITRFHYWLIQTEYVQALLVKFKIITRLLKRSVRSSTTHTRNIFGPQTRSTYFILMY